MLQLKNISKSYTTGDFTQVALDNVSLNLRANEFVAILGPSGSGKTTSLNIIGGLDQYDSGDLVINGKSTQQFSESDWDAYRNNSVGFIFQSYNLINHLSIMDNVEMGMTLSGVPATEKREKARIVLERVGLKDHMHKKPNQLSGGQMQRVAIARALANDPDIILADEPTGALDTATSEQIMELIKEIAKDKLVVMVTHNPELAAKYTDRTVEFRDGRIISDSNPLPEQKVSSDYQLKKTSMSFLTALKLSGKNILTKKWRTTLTAFASSIGIIGIALILSLSNGFNKQITNYEAGALSNFPVMINYSAVSMDLTEAMAEDPEDTLTEFPDSTNVYPYDPSENTIVHNNVITKDYLVHLEGLDPKLVDGTSYVRSVNMNILKSDGNTATAVNAAGFTSFPSKNGSDPGSYLEKYYDLLAGSFPSKDTDLVLILDKYNRLDVATVETLGLDYEADHISFDEIIGKEFRLIPNDVYYVKSGDLYTVNGSASNLMEMYNSPDAVSVKIAGIVRLQEESPMSTLSAGISYSDGLAQNFIETAQNSEIVKAQEASDDINVLTGEVFSKTAGQSAGVGPSAMMPGAGGSSIMETKEGVLTLLGASSIPSSISIYPVDFDAKEEIVAYLDKWNEGLSSEDKIVYTDMAALVTSLSGGIMNAITLVLIAFASISLVVSMIMIGIITYISVLERTKEIGVLRALGARKKDITRVFNAETFIIGSFSGLLAIGITYLLTIPTNMIIKSLTDLSNVSLLNPLHAILLILLNVLLTILGGFIPAKLAARKNPVTALRSE
ncbi:ABC transporter ATP-binding protein/permease [Paenibacillus brevis]|uniref:ABC transporter ATP-binding protein/permease n=1 Tax=Paenibacillus brevis TaxID=2841508 RepID=A0ABS6FWN2_9BACL|nr:ABC transporter ATP-binding protein/permease [Paenibacillus brevis]MBU5674637.1 ABC transporter ATP-binding protein/permease [Paenibacillus brevis]